MNGGLDLRTLVLLLVGAGTTYVAFLYPTLGVALLVGIAAVGLLHLLLKQQ
ncbi:hypothetical protein OG858_47245 (plasmid) [Streptomyces europaeiscabiei]|uniref:hypothetical protein n=1 Tax=Streptomyces europaeiscabiei TaxID=146819 RepID=UPI002E82333A|nr:hypothetical protein [Streptomyces europaeiscabiei]WUD38797.1 hypothetical protein OG858_47245 [Streptomyces europaeiscabiei]